MWRATTDAEADFIFDLLADPDASGPLLEYARWLDEQGDARRGEFLRLELAPRENEPRLRVLREQLDERWLATVTGRRFRVGDVVQILAGVCEGIEGRIAEIDPRHGRAGLLLHIFSRQTELIRVAFTDLRLVRRSAIG
jgi:uncharacterized protein (TIGR02996 family)